MKSKWRKAMALVLMVVLTLTSIPTNGFRIASAAEVTKEKKVYYNFTDYSSTIINDSSGKGNAAVMRNYDAGGFKIVDANIYGKEVKALSLPGGKDGGYLEFPAGILSGLDSATVSMWVNLSTDTGYQRIWDFGSDTTSYIYLLSDGGNDGFKGYASGITTGGWSKEQGVSLESGITKNRWVLCTVVMEGSNMSLYANDQLVGTKDTGIKLSDLGSTTKNYIGYGQFGDDPTKGQFAEVSIYNYAMTEAEVKALYTVDDSGIVAGDAAVINLGDLSAVTSDITLPTTGANGSTITWAVTGSAVVVSGASVTVSGSAITIDNNVAKVTRPAAGEADASLSLIATIQYNAASLQKTFDVTVLANYSDEQMVDYDLAAITFPDLSAITTDLTLPTVGEKGSIITWSVNPTGVIGTDGKVTRPETGKSNATVELTATVQYGAVQKARKFTATVIAKREVLEIKGYEAITVNTTAGYSPQLPNFVKVTYSNGSTGRIKTIWPTIIDADEYAAVGTFKVSGKMVGESMAIEATVNVVKESAAVEEVTATAFNLNEITLDGDSILTQNRSRTIAYLKLLDNKRMLYNFYNTFGQTDKIKDVTPLGGWDEPTGLLRGHSTGHYLSALSYAYASTGDEELKTKLTDMVHELRTLQKLSSGDVTKFTSKGTDQSVWSTDYTTWGEGYLGAYSPDQFALLEKYTPYATIWAPYYTMNYILVGFLDAYQYAGNEEAKEAAVALGKWAYRRLSVLPQEQRTKMWDMYIAGEIDSFNGTMARLYLLTGESEFLAGTKLFDNTKFFDNITKNIDDIAGRHANMHIPQLTGALWEYAASVKAGSPDMYYYNIAENFWNIAVSRYMYSIGGFGRGEMFKEAYQLANNIDSDTNCETCCAYNMLKLTKLLYQYDPENAEFMDYYERALYNQIIGSQNPHVTSTMHNGVVYMLPIGPGTSKKWTNDYESFTCCDGTGMESHVKYQEAAYYKSDSTLYVNLYLPSTLTWEEKGITVAQENTYPSEHTQLTVSAITGSAITAQNINMKFRVPYWATDGFTVKVNGVTKIEKPEISTYVEVKDIKAGDVITIDMPYTYHLDKTSDKLGSSTLGSVMYGPFVMVANNSDTNWKTLVLSDVLSESIKKVDTESVPTLIINNMTFKPIYDAADYSYHTYFKIITGTDDGLPYYDVTVTNTTPKLGTISVDTDLVKEGSNVKITAAPKDGYKVKSLTVNGEAVTVGADNTYVISNVKSALKIEVSFKLITPPIPDPTCLDQAAEPSAHYTASWETINGINNKEFEPTASKSGTGLGWGDFSQQPGSSAWVMYTWESAVTMDTFQIYWYDDGGETRVPATISFDYLDESGAWQPVTMLSEYKDIIAIDKYNTIKIQPVKGTAIRINMTIAAEKHATGIYRWKVTGPVTKEAAIKALNEAVALAKTKLQAEYTPASWAQFQTALTAANSVLTNSAATAEQLTAAKTALNDAMSKLVTTADEEKAASVKALNEAVALAKTKLQANYTAASWSKLQTALTAANNVLANSAATTAQLKEAKTVLNTAINSLVNINSGSSGSSGGSSSVTTPTPIPTPTIAPAKSTTVDVPKDTKAVTIPISVIDNVKDGKAEVEVKLSKEAAVDSITLAKETLAEAAKEKIDLVINITDSTGTSIASWKLSSDLLKKADNVNDINLAVTVEEADDAKESNAVLSKVLPAAENRGVVVSVAQDGKLAVQGDLTVKVADAIIGQKVYIYKLNNETKKLESIVGGYSKAVDQNGSVTFGVLEGADYVVLTSKASSENITSLTSQITVKASKKKVAVGKSLDILVTLPTCLEKTDKLTENTGSNAVGAATITYKVSNKKVAAVNSDGKVIAKKAGTVTVTATITLYNGKTKKVKTKLTVK